MTDMDMAERIQKAGILDIGFAYLAYAGLPFLAWPLPTMPFDPAAWLGQIAAAVANAPVCGRTEEQVSGELGRIDNRHVRRAMARMVHGG